MSLYLLWGKKNWAWKDARNFTSWAAFGGSKQLKLIARRGLVQLLEKRVYVKHNRVAHTLLEHALNSCSMNGWNMWNWQSYPMLIKVTQPLSGLNLGLLCNWGTVSSFSSFTIHLGNILLFTTRTLCASSSSLLFVYISSLRLADSDFLSLLIHAGRKLGTLRECTKFLMNPEYLVGNVGSIPVWQMASWWGDTDILSTIPKEQWKSWKEAGNQLVFSV